MSENPDAIGPGEVDAGTEDAHRPIDQEPLFRMDERPPDSYGLDYVGQACRDRQHERCPGYWGDGLRSGQGTRCACLCHEEVTPNE